MATGIRDDSVPPPSGAMQRRDAPFFKKYVLTGKTYRTANGAVIPNELQYYNGEMLQFYGECTNISAVNEAVAASGYKPLTLRYADGTHSAVGQLWVSRFTETSIGPYSALFLVIVVVPDTVPPRAASLAADPNGASSAVAMFDGAFDAGTGVYENRARLFLVRLIDTTQVAIDVGRERMGTDKRPGTVEMTRHGQRLRLAIGDQRGRSVVRAELELVDDPAVYSAQIAKAAATAGIPLRTLPPGTEYAYPAAARIGRGAVVSWHWRSDVVPRLQAVTPGTVAFDARSEEGRLLLGWGFTPKVLAYIPSVRGVVTGLADPAAPRLPILRLAGTGPAPEVAAPMKLRPYEADGGASPVASPQPRWAWGTTFLGSLTAWLRKEVVGVTPDGLRINWHVTKGTFTGPGFDAVVLPGAADWMRIRRDGIAIVSVQACFEMGHGARVYGSYGGVFDLGRDGYARALRDEYDYLPPVVVTPTYATADARLDWLNRAQFLGVGRVDMTALRVEFDVYVVRVGQRLPQAAESTARPHGSLYDRLGGHRVIVGITDDFVSAVLADRQLGRFFAAAPVQEGLRERVIDLLCEITGGPCVYKGRDMKTAHEGMGITEVDWKIAVDLFTDALDKRHVGARERVEFLQIIENMKSQIVERRGRSQAP